MSTPPLGRPRRRDQITGVIQSVFDFLLPPVCPACVRRLTDDEYGLCADCLARIERPEPPLCPHCGRPRPRLRTQTKEEGKAAGTPAGGARDEGGKGGNREEAGPEGTAGQGGQCAVGNEGSDTEQRGSERCESCKHLPTGGFDSARAAFLYSGPLIDTLHHLKYHRREEISECLGRWLFRYWREGWPDATNVDCIVPVPLHPWRLWSRGFNQSESLARVLSRFSGVPLATRSLARVRATRTQTRLKPKQRLKNVADAFHAVDPAAIQGQRILLIDDVMTTGATLTSAAQALRAAGATNIFALAFARALPH